MKKLVSILLGICLSISALAQDKIPSLQNIVELKERRIYYVDITASMTGYNRNENIWNKVTTNLNKAIDNIQDEDTEIIIKTFTDSNHSVETIASEYATEKGKKKLKNRISELNPKQNTLCHTDIFVPFNDFYKQGIAKGKVNYFFLMTDGSQYSEGAEQLTMAIEKWNDKTKNGEKHIYGFYVMLCDSAQLSPKYSHSIKKQKHLWTIRSASVDINLIRPKKNEFVCNIRNNDSKRYIDIPMNGRIQEKGLSIHGENGYCKVERSE